MGTSKSKKNGLKDFLQQIDAVLHDNSVAAQQFQQKVLDLVHQPNQFVVNHGVLSCDGELYQHTDLWLETILDSMTDEPLPENAEPSILPCPGMVNNFAEAHYDQDYSLFSITSASLVVDGILYTGTSACSPMFTFKEPW